MSKYGNKKCIKFAGDSSIDKGYGLVADVPLSFSAGVFGNGGGTSPYEFSYSWWIKKDFSKEGSAGSSNETVYQIANEQIGILDIHTFLTVRGDDSNPNQRYVQIQMENGSGATVPPPGQQYIMKWTGIDNDFFNESEKWTHFVLSFNGDMNDNTSATLYINSVSGVVDVVKSSSLSDPYTVDGEGSPDTNTNTWNWQSLGMARNDDNVVPPVGGDKFLNAKIANFAIWNKMLSQAEVSEIYNDGRLVDLNTSTMNSNLVQWNKCGNYYGDNVNLLNNIAGGPVDVSGTFSLQRGIGYLPTYQQTLIEDPVSTDMVFMDGFDQNTIDGVSPSTNGLTALNLRGWQNTVALRAGSNFCKIQRGGQKGTANTSHWPTLDYSNSYITSEKNKHLVLWPYTSSPTDHGTPGNQMN
jgi:hypothetical protein